MSDFKDRLRDLRKGKGISQDLLAEKLSLRSGKQTISNWETGRTEPTLSDVRRLAELLDTSISYLIDGFGSSKNEDPNPGLKCIPTEEYIRLLEKALRYEELLKSQEAKA